MSVTNKFYIGQIGGSGLQTDLKPYAIPDEAFAELNNAYIFRGRVRKRFGEQLMRGTAAQIPGFEQIQSRLKVKIGTTNGSGNLSVTVPGSTFAAGQAFSCGDEFFTVSQTGTPAVMLTTGAATTHTYNTTTGAVVINGSHAATDVYFFPATPVMGLDTYERPEVNAEQVIGFDTQFAYEFAANGWERMDTEAAPGDALWTGSNSDFFWGTNWRGSTSAQTYFFVTNYHVGTNAGDSDSIRYWNGTQWASYTPGFSSGTATNLILTSRIILPFKDRLVLLNVVENTGGGAGTNATYVNRCRYSWNGDPTNATAFYEDLSGAGGYIDAPTKQAIVTAQFLKDRLIVYFEASTWELAYTGNQVLPFVWQQINTELGAESTFSQVPFDKVVLGVGNVGIHACTGNNVDRIDEKIPDEVFRIHNDNNGVERVAGIRDYYTEMVYWTFPSEDRSTDFPFNNRILTYNYKTGSWGFNDDSITAFGYFQTTIDGTLGGLTWAECNMNWEDAGFPWRSAILQAKFKNVIAGNQEGYTFIINPDLYANCPALQVSNATYTTLFTITLNIVNHNLDNGDYVKLENMNGLVITNPDGDVVDSIILMVQDALSSPNQVVLRATNVGFTGTYTGAGTLTRVTPINFKTKQFNFYGDSGRNTYISKVDFLVDRTAGGECTVNFGISSSPFGSILGGQITGALMGDYVLETSPYALSPLEQQQDRLWHPVFFQADGQYVQFFFYLNEDQSMDEDIAESNFELHAMIIYSQPTSYRLG